VVGQVVGQVVGPFLSIFGVILPKNSHYNPVN
jgi:hypothetical protein